MAIAFHMRSVLCVYSRCWLGPNYYQASWVSSASLLVGPIRERLVSLWLSLISVVHTNADSTGLRMRRTAVSNRYSQKYIFRANLLLRILLTRETAKSSVACQSEFIRARLSHGQVTMIHARNDYENAAYAHLHEVFALWWIGSQSPLWRVYVSLHLYAGR